MKLEEIGFYTLTDERAVNGGVDTPLQRCEMILTPACNFSCKYCRPIRNDYADTISLEAAKEVLDKWASHGLVNVRFSGGEPTIWYGIVELVAHAKNLGIKRIAISTNGSASREMYQALLDAGANDFSVSLDACCASTGDTMAATEGVWDTVIGNIQFLAANTYTTVGVVVTEENLGELSETIKLASSLGVADIRVIPAAQWDQEVRNKIEIPEEVLEKHPILKYRMSGRRHVRALQPEDTNRCPLVLDDMAVAGGKHFPCIIYMREHGDPIGTMEGKSMNEIRGERRRWAEQHDTHKDVICSRNCLDVCIDFNNMRARIVE